MEQLETSVELLINEIGFLLDTTVTTTLNDVTQHLGQIGRALPSAIRTGWAKMQFSPIDLIDKRGSTFDILTHPNLLVNNQYWTRLSKFQSHVNLHQVHGVQLVMLMNQLTITCLQALHAQLLLVQSSLVPFEYKTMAALYYTSQTNILLNHFQNRIQYKSTLHLTRYQNENTNFGIPMLQVVLGLEPKQSDSDSGDDNMETDIQKVADEKPIVVYIPQVVDILSLFWPLSNIEAVTGGIDDSSSAVSPLPFYTESLVRTTFTWPFAGTDHPDLQGRYTWKTWAQKERIVWLLLAHLQQLFDRELAFELASMLVLSVSPALRSKQEQSESEGSKKKKKTDKDAIDEYFVQVAAFYTWQKLTAKEKAEKVVDETTGKERLVHPEVRRPEIPYRLRGKLFNSIVPNRFALFPVLRLVNNVWQTSMKEPIFSTSDHFLCLSSNASIQVVEQEAYLEHFIKSHSFSAKRLFGMVGNVEQVTRDYVLAFSGNNILANLFSVRLEVVDREFKVISKLELDNFLQYWLKKWPARWQFERPAFLYRTLFKRLYPMDERVAINTVKLDYVSNRVEGSMLETIQLQQDPVTQWPLFVDNSSIEQDDSTGDIVLNRASSIAFDVENRVHNLDKRMETRLHLLLDNASLVDQSLMDDLGLNKTDATLWPSMYLHLVQVPLYVLEQLAVKLDMQSRSQKGQEFTLGISYSQLLDVHTSQRLILTILGDYWQTQYLKIFGRKLPVYNAAMSQIMAKMRVPVYTYYTHPSNLQIFDEAYYERNLIDMMQAVRQGRKELAPSLVRASKKGPYSVFDRLTPSPFLVKAQTLYYVFPRLANGNIYFEPSLFERTNFSAFLVTDSAKRGIHPATWWLYVFDTQTSLTLEQDKPSISVDQLRELLLARDQRNMLAQFEFDPNLEAFLEQESELDWLDEPSVLELDANLMPRGIKRPAPTPLELEFDQARPSSIVMTEQAFISNHVTSVQQDVYAIETDDWDYEE